MLRMGGCLLVRLGWKGWRARLLGQWRGLDLSLCRGSEFDKEIWREWAVDRCYVVYMESAWEMSGLGAIMAYLLRMMTTSTLASENNISISAAFFCGCEDLLSSRA